LSDAYHGKPARTSMPRCMIIYVLGSAADYTSALDTGHVKGIRALCPVPAVARK
jgi:hypothetical protein